MENQPWGMQVVFRFALDDPREATFWIHPFVMPFFTLFGTPVDAARSGGMMHAWVPTTDGGHYFYSVGWNADEPYTEEMKRSLDEAAGYLDVDKENGYVSTAWTGDGYVQDRQAMRENHSFSGFSGGRPAGHGRAAQHGPIVDRTREHLAPRTSW